MRIYGAVIGLVVGLVCPVLLGQDISKDVRRAVMQATLDQKGTKPFYLKADLWPSPNQRNSDPARTGTVEIWWQSPEVWRREVRSPEFHQVRIVNQGKVWEKDEGDYFPEWLRNMAVELVSPVPPLEHVLAEVKDADIKKLMGNTYAQWQVIGSDGVVSKGIGSSVALYPDGSFFYGGDPGWGVLYKKYGDFHGRKYPLMATAGSPEVTSTVVLRDLPKEPGDFFSTEVAGGNAPIDTAILTEAEARKNLLPIEPIVWDKTAAGPAEGLITEISIDREGKVRDHGPVVMSRKPAVDNKVLLDWIMAQRFRPYVVNGVTQQVVTTFTAAFLPDGTAKP